MRMCGLMLACLICAAGVAGQSIAEQVAGFEDAKKYKIDHDRFADRTTITTPLEFAVKIGGGKHYSVVTSVAAGFDKGKPGRVFLDVLWPSRTPEIITSARLLIDGERLELLAAAADTRGSPSYGIGLRGRNSARFEITPELWRRISAAKLVEWQIAREEFTLRPITQKRINALIAVKTQ